MSFPRYPNYKDSGVEWLGEVPAHWKTLKFGHLLKSPPCYGVLVPDFEQDGIPMLRITDMESGNADRASLNTISHALSAQYSRTIIEEGDVVLSVVGTIGKAFQVDAALAGVNLSRAVARLQLDKAITPEFACWIFQTLQFKRYIDLVCVGTAQRVLNMADLSAFRIVNPIISEQTQIAAFLDRETAKIDALVAEQQRLMELLKEKRQAVISHAVTQGLNPKAPMKPSGIEWLGDVPAHWEVCALRRIVRMQSGESITAESIDDTGEYPVFGGNGLRGYTSGFTNDGKFVLIGRQGALCGNINYATGKFWASEHAVVATPIKQVEAAWLGEMLRAMNLNQYSIAAAQPGLSVDLVGRLGVCVPPLAEQIQIATFLDKETAKLDTLTIEAQHAIDLLQERRTALISAAVTGQIDVRPFTEQEAA